MTLLTLSGLRPTTQELLAEAENFGLKYGTCDRLRVGCILLNKKGQLVAKAANCSIGSLPSCDQEGHLMEDGHCQRTIHAEQRAISLALTREMSMLDGTVYISHTPCLHCAKLLISCGVKEIFYKNEYHNVISKKLLKELSKKTGVKIGKA